MTVASGDDSEVESRVRPLKKGSATSKSLSAKSSGVARTGSGNKASPLETLKSKGAMPDNIVACVNGVETDVDDIDRALLEGRREGGCEAMSELWLRSRRISQRGEQLMKYGPEGQWVPGSIVRGLRNADSYEPGPGVNILPLSVWVSLASLLSVGMAKQPAQARGFSGLKIRFPTSAALTRRGNDFTQQQLLTVWETHG